MIRALFALFLLSAAPAVAQQTNTIVQQQPVRYLVVLNKQGPAWDQLKSYRQAAIAHHQLYRSLAEKGDIVVGGRLDGFSGEPALGISVFRQGTDRAAIEKILREDEIVKAGVLALEFRAWHIQLGALAVE